MTPKDMPGWGDNLERLITIFFLGVVSVSSIAGVIWLAIDGKDAPDALQIIGAASVGSLGGMLSGGKS